MGSRLEGGVQIPDPSSGPTATVGAGGGGEKKRDGIQIQQYGCTLQIRLDLGDLG